VLSKDQFFRELLLGQDSHGNSSSALRTHILMPDFSYESVRRLLDAFYTGLIRETNFTCTSSKFSKVSDSFLLR
jgi:hypothetical protein